MDYPAPVSGAAAGINLRLFPGGLTLPVAGPLVLPNAVDRKQNIHKMGVTSSLKYC